ncbi:unnamed protein product [Linum tenue]|uniref:Uncharacterized protein n=1 Tax=Linum tenue TaxID=586396 RepID=A0AAV0QP79_9ROSI|nr:unnamed protein product [Linum tenue]
MLLGAPVRPARLHVQHSADHCSPSFTLQTPSNWLRR